MSRLLQLDQGYRPGLSIKYNNLKEGKATTIKINAGVIVQINSKTVPCVKYL